MLHIQFIEDIALDKHNNWWIDPKVKLGHFGCYLCGWPEGIFSCNLTKEEVSLLKTMPDIIPFLKCPRGHTLDIICYRGFDDVDTDGYPIQYNIEGQDD